jgi:hypothetical protein
LIGFAENQTDEEFLRMLKSSRRHATERNKQQLAYTYPLMKDKISPEKRELFEKVFDEELGGERKAESIRIGRGLIKEFLASAMGRDYAATRSFYNTLETTPSISEMVHNAAQSLTDEEKEEIADRYDDHHRALDYIDTITRYSGNHLPEPDYDVVNKNEWSKWEDLTEEDQEILKKKFQYDQNISNIEDYSFKLNDAGKPEYQETEDEDEEEPSEEEYQYGALNEDEWTRWEDLTSQDRSHIRELGLSRVPSQQAWMLSNGEPIHISEEEAFPSEDEDDDDYSDDTDDEDILTAGKYKYKLAGNSRRTAETVQGAARKIFGKEMEISEILKFTAIDAFSDQFPDFAPTIGVDSTGAIEINYDKRGQVDISREIKLHNGEPYIYNSHQYLSAEHQGQGLGIKVFSEQVAAAIQHGVKTIHCTAGKSSSMNGYITWPKFGYDGEIKLGWFESLHSSGIQDRDELALKLVELTGRTEEDIRGGEAKISDLMKSKEGTEFWIKHGYQFSADFDLSEGSLSRKILSRYLKYKGIDKEEDPDRFRKLRRTSRFALSAGPNLFSKSKDKKKKK